MKFSYKNWLAPATCNKGCGKTLRVADEKNEYGNWYSFRCPKCRSLYHHTEKEIEAQTFAYRMIFDAYELTLELPSFDVYTSNYTQLKEIANRYGAEINLAYCGEPLDIERALMVLSWKNAFPGAHVFHDAISKINDLLNEHLYSVEIIIQERCSQDPEVLKYKDIPSFLEDMRISHNNRGRSSDYALYGYRSKVLSVSIGLPEIGRRLILDEFMCGIDLHYLWANIKWLYNLGTYTAILADKGHSVTDILGCIYGMCRRYSMPELLESWLYRIADPTEEWNNPAFYWREFKGSNLFDPFFEYGENDEVYEDFFSDWLGPVLETVA